MSARITRTVLSNTVACAALILLVLLAYSNHFENAFHFDDFHTIADNPYIRDLRNVQKFFTDARMFSTLPDHAVYRPIVSASLALDYHFARGMVAYHVSTFVWYCLQLVLMFFLFRRIMGIADPHPSNFWAALAAAAVYGLHPANAETVNYIIQRADIYSTLGVVAGLLWFAAYPKQRKWGWYMLPVVLAALSKPSALVFPLILLAYVWIFEKKSEFRAVGLVTLVTAALAVFTAKMTPPSFASGALSASLYRLTQPWVALHYFKVFFLPTDLSADSDWGYVSSPFCLHAVLGYVFVTALLAVAVYTARQRKTRPISFGIWWFFIALLPTSLMPLAEVTNDHRMFFPFVGLTLSVVWTLRLLRQGATLARAASHLSIRRRKITQVAVASLCLVLVAEAAGTFRRNTVWHTEESLWRDVTVKSPNNGRGLMNYGITFFPKREYAAALEYLLRAERLVPNYSYVHVNLGIAYHALGREPEAQAHYRRAKELGFPSD